MFKKVLTGVLTLAMAVTAFGSNITTNASEPEEHILFEGSASSTFKKWGDDWKDAVNIPKKSIDFLNVTEPITIKVNYQATADPYLIMQSWTGGTEWVQMQPSYSSNGVAYYKYDLISSSYGSDFSKLNAIRVMPAPSNDPLTVTKVSWYYESDDQEEIEVNYSGTAGRVINNIKAGWNLGNTLDSHGEWIDLYTNRNPSDYETAWGNPVTTKSMIDSIKAAGFNAVRVPVTWLHHINDSNNYKIKSAWMARVKEVVNYVIDNGMYCIINVHHDTGAEDDAWLEATPSCVQQQSAKFAAVWTQIANEFKSYDEHLLFEGFNEILDDNNNWSYPGKSAGNAVNSLNQTFVDTVRATGGNNANRCLIVNTYAAAYSSSLLDDFVVPQDSAENAIMVEVHHYAPNSFCFDITKTSNKQTIWTENGGKVVADNMLYNLYSHFTSKGIPVIIGEFGASNKDNEDQRAEWAKYIVRNAKKYGIKCFWWDHGSRFTIDSEFGYYKGMAVYDRYNDKIVFPELVKALTCLGELKYQLRPNDNGTTDVRFILIADQEDILAADSATLYATVPDMGDTASISIKRAYRSIKSAGKTINADDGKAFLIGKFVGIPDDMVEGITGHFTLGEFAYERVILT